MTLYPVILSGGSGSRLWPLSREHYPKPLLPLDTDKTLLQDTATRLDGVPDQGDAVYVCNEEHRFLLAEQVTQLGKDPVHHHPRTRRAEYGTGVDARGTVPSNVSHPDALMIVMPADHVMRAPGRFMAAVRRVVTGCRAAPRDLRHRAGCTGNRLRLYQARCELSKVTGVLAVGAIRGETGTGDG